MDTQATQIQYTPGGELFLALELDEVHWKLGFTTGLGQRPRERTIPARDLEALEREVGLARRRFSLADEAAVHSCYEAGREGFWLHRYLVAHGIDNVVVDSSSIEVPRRKRRTKTDRMDVGKLLGMLLRYRGGEGKVWSVVRVPSAEAEDRRLLHRELAGLKKERTRHINRIKGLLALQGTRLPVGRDFLSRLEEVRLWDGTSLSSGLRTRLEHDWQRMQLVEEHIQALEAQRVELLRTAQDPALRMVRHFLRLKSIGINASWTFTMELFAWRRFNHAGEVGALVGLTPTPYQSGATAREQGISKAGNPYVRPLLIQIAWAWLRFQPQSELSRWYQERFGQGGSRLRRIGIVALARRLLIALWRYVETGEVPVGATLKTVHI